MGLFADSLERRDATETTLLSDPAGWLWEAFGVTPTDAGIAVSGKSSLKCTAVYTCINVLGQTCAQVPWNVYRQDGKKKSIAVDRPEHYLLHNEPIATMNSYNFRVALMANILLYGNGYVEIIRDNSNRVRALRLLPAWTVAVYESLDQERLVYKVTRFDGSVDTLDVSDVIHIPCISLDGIAGLSPIAQHRQAVGLALAAEAAGASFFGNGSRPSGYLSSDRPLRPGQREEIQEKWFTKFGGPKNTGKVPVLGSGLKWNALSIPPGDAQYIETRTFQVADIARIYRVPAVLAGLADKSATYASADAFFLAFVKFTMAPWFQAIEQEFDRKLFPNTNSLYCKFDMNGLLRGDAKGRALFYKTLWACGAMSADEIRDWEELDPAPGGDRYFIQQGFMPTDKVDEVLANQGKGQNPTPQQDPGDVNNPDPQMRGAHIAWLKDVADRIGKWETRNPVKVAEAFEPVFANLAEYTRSRGAKLAAPKFAEVLAQEFIPGAEKFAERSVDRFLAGVAK